MPATGVVRRTGGHVITVAGLAVGLGAGVLAGALLPSMPWVAVLVAAVLTVVLGGAGFVFSGEVFTASCPCCQARTVATTWRQAFQCRHCRTMCALASLSRRQHLRRVPDGRRF
jgi:hypothetical protein